MESNNMTYRVSFDKTFETGLLAGLTVTDQGYNVPTWADGASDIRKMRKQATGSDCLTGNVFTRSNLRLLSVMADGATQVAMTDECCLCNKTHPNQECAA